MTDDCDDWDEDEANAAMDLDGTPPARKKGVRASDLNPARKRVLVRSLPHFRFKIATESPYPADQQMDSWAVSSWNEGLSELAVSHGYVGRPPPTEDELCLVSDSYNYHWGNIDVNVQDQNASLSAPRPSQGQSTGGCWSCLRIRRYSFECR